MSNETEDGITTRAHCAECAMGSTWAGPLSGTKLVFCRRCNRSTQHVFGSQRLTQNGIEMTISNTGPVISRGENFEIAALIRDGNRFRRLEAKHAKQEGSGGWCKRCYEGFADGDFEQVEQPLAEIADALPEANP